VLLAREHAPCTSGSLQGMSPALGMEVQRHSSTLRLSCRWKRSLATHSSRADRRTAERRSDDPSGRPSQNTPSTKHGDGGCHSRCGLAVRGRGVLRGRSPGLRTVLAHRFPLSLAFPPGHRSDTKRVAESSSPTSSSVSSYALHSIARKN